MAKINRALIIRRQQVELSKFYAQQCADSCVKHGLSFEFIDAVEYLSCEDAFKSVGAKKSKHYKNTMGNCCCHSSHIKCWKRIIEIDKPCLILEHDAIVVGDVKNIEIPDMVVTTFGHRVTQVDEYTPPGSAERLVEIEKAIGVHACGLSPVTAKWLFEDARDNGVKIGVDKWLMMKKESGLPLYVCEPPQVVCWARISTSNFKKGEQRDDVQNPRNRVAHNYKESYTDGWIKGLKK